MAQRQVGEGEQGASASSPTVVEAVATGSKAAPAAPVSFVGAATGTSLLAANANRLAAVIRNVGTNPLYLGKDNTVSPTVYNQVLMPMEALIDDKSADAYFGNTTSGQTATASIEEITT